MCRGGGGGFECVWGVMTSVSCDSVSLVSSLSGCYVNRHMGDH